MQLYEEPRTTLTCHLATKSIPSVPSAPKLRFRTFVVHCHMTSQIIGSGKNKCKTTVCSMESKKDDSPLMDRFLTVRKEIMKTDSVSSMVLINSQ